MRRFHEFHCSQQKVRNNIGLSERFIYLEVASSGLCLLPYALNVWFEDGVSLWYMVERCPHGMIAGCYGLSNHVSHVLKPMYISDRRGGCRASDAFLIGE